MIRLTDVTKTFAGPRPRTVLDRVSLDVPRGQLAAILGESGAGKSTLLNVIAGLETADAGTVIVGDVDLAGLDDDALTAFRRDARRLRLPGVPRAAVPVRRATTSRCR